MENPLELISCPSLYSTKKKLNNFTYAFSAVTDSLQQNVKKNVIEFLRKIQCGTHWS